MRLAPLLALLGSGLALLAAPALHAQADPNPPEAYYPLHVGDQWEYQQFADPSPFPITDPYSRSTVTSDTVAGGRRYFVVRHQAFIRQNGALSVSQYRSVVRFDTATASVRILQNGGTTEGTVLPCRLDLPVPAGGSAPCSGGTPPTYTFAPDTTIAIGGTLLTTSVRGFVQSGFYTTRYAAGIGYLGGEGCEIGCSDVRLVYARIDGVEYGQKLGIGYEPDLTPPADYYPLEVGNEWILRYTERSVIGTSDVYVRRRVLREAAVGGQTYAVDQSCIYNNLHPAPTWVCEPERLVRFDAATTNVVLGSATGESIYICNLGADFDTLRPTPQGSCSGFGYTGYQPATVEIGGVIYSAPSFKVPSVPTLGGGPPGFVAGIGETPGEPGPFRTSSFEFARVRGVEYGVRPVAGESGAPGASALALAAAPNPTAGSLRLALSLPEAGTVTAEAFDALGRRVWQAAVPMAAGPQTIDVDASAWAPGLYVVRATAGQATATARVVRR